MSVSSIPIYPAYFITHRKSWIFWRPKCPFWTPAALKRDMMWYEILRPSFFQHIAHLSCQNGHFWGGVGGLHILCWETTINTQFIAHNIVKICMMNFQLSPWFYIIIYSLLPTHGNITLPASVHIHYWQRILHIFKPHRLYHASSIIELYYIIEPLWYKIICISLSYYICMHLFKQHWLYYIY